MAEVLTIETIKQTHPFPWRHAVTPAPRGQVGAQVRIIDAANKEVPLFTIVAMCEIVTKRLSFKEQA